ncbi:hypothetical protein TruAng_008571 [Truncatella angustata]|nr:hypothetical protein TruAng_008571 [Truncatella angustata]
MDDGSRQEAMVEQLKAEVKTKAHQRRGRKALQRIGADLHCASGPVNSICGSSPPPNNPLGPNERPRTSSQQCSIPASEPSLIPPEPSTLLPLPKTTDSDVGLVIAYLDYVVPLLFPFYQPPISAGGRAWLLAEIVRSDAFRLHTNALTSHLLSVIPSRPEIMMPCFQLYSLENTQSQRSMAVEHLQDELEDLKRRGAHDNLRRSTSAINSITRLIDIERVLAKEDVWQVHLRAVLGVLDDILRQPARFEVSTWLMVLGQLSQPPHSTEHQTWSAPRASFRFSAANLVVCDILASTSLEQPPVLINHYRNLLHHDDRSNADTSTLQLSDINGCQNWAMQLLGETAALDAWKKEQRRASGAPYAEALHRRGAGIQARLQDGLARLVQSPEECGGVMALDTVTARPAPLGSLVTRLWAHASLVYLHVVLHGWQPFKGEIRRAVSQGIDILDELSPTIAHLRTQAWPICVVGCLATEQQKAVLRRLWDKLGPLSGFGSISIVMEILQRVWSTRPLYDLDRWDISACLNVLGQKPPEGLRTDPYSTSLTLAGMRTVIEGDLGD